MHFRGLPWISGDVTGKKTGKLLTFGSVFVAVVYVAAARDGNLPEDGVTTTLILSSGALPDLLALGTSKRGSNTARPHFDPSWRRSVPIPRSVRLADSVYRAVIAAYALDFDDARLSSLPGRAPFAIRGESRCRSNAKPGNSLATFGFARS